MTLNGSGDALTTYGSIYMVDSKLTGDGDTILGYAALVLPALRDPVGRAVHLDAHATRTAHGNVFVDSQLHYVDKPCPGR